MEGNTLSTPFVQPDRRCGTVRWSAGKESTTIRCRVNLDGYDLKYPESEVSLPYLRSVSRTSGRDEGGV